MPISAIRPSVEHRDAFLAMLADFDARSPHDAAQYAPANADFAAYVRSLWDEERGENLPESWVPCTLGRVLLVTGATNRASRAVIERQGGLLESIAYSEFWAEDLCRYWITLPRHG